MGDVQTHKAIFESAVQPALQEARPGEDYLCVRLGNYLTDLSQVRDTLAYALAKPRILAVARQKTALLRVPVLAGILSSIIEIPGYIDDLLGRTTGVEDAALARYLDSVVRAVTIETFAKSDGLPEPEVLRIYDRNFTRYYPHEHLDFPPWPYTDPIGDRTIEPSARMLRSLAEQMEYLIQALTAVEYSWTLSLDQGTQSAARHNALADLGHTLHSIEDFYFHTNFLEINQLLRSARRFPGPDAVHSGPFWEWFVDHALDDVDTADDEVRYRRRYFRRLRNPVAGKDKSQLSTITSLDASAYLSTGGFGATDIFHTLYGQLSGLAANLDPALVKELKKIVLARNLLFEADRRALADDAVFRQELQAHAQQLEDPNFAHRIDQAVQLGLLRPATAKAVKEAVALDRQLTRRYPQLPGIGGFLLSIASMLQQEHDNSEALSRAFDQENLVLDGRSAHCESAGQRCASAETIGTHSLLAKDTEHSAPFRPEAVTYASFVSGFFARTLARHVGSPQELNWRPVVSHFLRYPHIDDITWESQLLETSNAFGPGVGYDQLADRPQFEDMTSRNLATLFHMQPAKTNLAYRYDAEAQQANQAWQDR
jgi:hypothetical protein